MEPPHNPLVSPMWSWIHIGGGFHFLDPLGGLGSGGGVGGVNFGGGD